MVYPIRRQGSPPPNRINLFPNQRVSRPPAAGGRQMRGNWQPMLQKGVDGVSKTLGNVQQVLDVVQSTTPIIQQYGPMVKNIPAMYRMFKAFKDADDSGESAASASVSEVSNTEAKSKEMTPSTRKTTSNSRGESTPKLFF